MCPPTTDLENLEKDPDYPKIEGYRILGVLGEGAVGTVYKARRTDTGVSVALKVLSVTGPKRRKHITRLVKEGRVIARLNHPGIVKGLDVGESGGLYFIAMELVDGKSIRDHLEAGRIFTEEEAVDIAMRAVRALHHAAKQGVIHRDIKPANLMLTEDGKVKITDLGLAKDAVDLSLTRSDATVGTPQYISPEQARDSQAVDVRSDIFSLGATLYHMVCGRPPFSGGSLAEIITKVLYESEQPVERLNPTLSVSFSKLLARILAKDPGDRYQNYAGLLADLDRVRTGRDIKGPVRRPGAQAFTWRQGLLAAVTLLAVGLVVFVWKPWRAEPKPPPEPPPVVKPEPKLPGVPPATPRWKIDLAQLRVRLLPMVRQGEIERAKAELDKVRLRFVKAGKEAERAFNELEEELERRFEIVKRRELTTELRALQKFTRERLATPALAPGTFKEIERRMLVLDEKLRDLPAFLQVDFGGPTKSGLDEVRGRAGSKSKALTRELLRAAREHEGRREFRAVKQVIDRLKSIDLDVFYPQSAPEVEAFHDQLKVSREKADQDYRRRYAAFWEGFQWRLGSWEYTRAEEQLVRFEANVRSWQVNAPAESHAVRALVVQDRSDYQGLVNVWRLARRRLEQLVRDKTPINLSFEGESSRKLIVDVEGEGAPELLRVRFRVGSRELTKPLTTLRPEDVAETLATRGGAVEPRWRALFYYFVATRENLPLGQRKELVRRAEKGFSESGGADRYAPLIAAVKEELAKGQQDRQQRAAALLAEARQLYAAWEFAMAATKLTRLKGDYADIWKANVETYKDLLTRARKSEPLEALQRRFPGAAWKHRDDVHPLAFRMTYTFGPDTNMTGIDYAWESWKLGVDGLGRVVEIGQPEPSSKFLRTWGVRLPVQLNYRRPVRVKLVLKTDAEKPMSLLAISAGGNIVGLVNLDGINVGNLSEKLRNQLNLWLFKPPPGAVRNDSDVFRGYEKHFAFQGNSKLPPGLKTDYRLHLGRRHELTLELDGKQRRFEFKADGVVRHRLGGRPTLKSLGEIEVRAWNKPLVVRELTIEGQLGR